jgi:transketolase
MTYENLLKETVLLDDRFVVMTAENRATIRGLAEALEDRFIDVGIAEQTLAGMAVGLALRGRVPVVHALAAFLTMRAFEFIRTDAGLPCLPVKLVGGAPGLLSTANGPTHQAIEDVALMRGIPNMQVFCPADEEDLLIGLPSVLASEEPTYVRFNDRKPVIRHDRSFAIGKAEVLARGIDVTIVTYGTLFAETCEAKFLLEAEGLSVGLINLRMLSPVDEDAVLRAARETSLLVTVEDHFLTGGLFSIVAELLMRRGTITHVLPIGFDRRWFRPGLLADVLAHEGLTGPQIKDRILEEWRRYAEHRPV